MKWELGYKWIFNKHKDSVIFDLFISSILVILVASFLLLKKSI